MRVNDLPEDSQQTVRVEPTVIPTLQMRDLQLGRLGTLPRSHGWGILELDSNPPLSDPERGVLPATRAIGRDQGLPVWGRTLGGIRNVLCREKGLHPICLHGEGWRVQRCV